MRSRIPKELSLDAKPSGQMTQADGQMVAFIDIGTNSIRLLLVQIQPDGTYLAVTERKETIRLGEGEFETKRLQPEAMDRALVVCRKLSDMATASGATEIVAVATSATREAANRTEFLEKLKRQAGLDVHAISGREEARLIYLGVSRGENMDDKTGLFIDIGGGSTELIVGTQEHYRYLTTTKLGAIRLAGLFPGDECGRMKKEAYGQLKDYIRDVSIRSIQNIQKLWADELGLVIGSSGTIENLADIAARRFLKRSREPDDLLTYDQLQTVVKDLRKLTVEERKKVPGINSGRVDIIVAGAAILDVLLDDLGLREVRVTSRTLRDGLLIDYLSRTGVPEADAGLSIRQQSVLRLGRSQAFDEEHARRVMDLATQLFDSGLAAGIHELGAWHRELLSHAAMLHDIGTSLSYSEHNAHSYYFIRNADLLGFNQEEVDIIAATAYYHRKAYPRKRDVEYASLDEDSQQVVSVLGVLLSLAESLDRSHMGLVEDVSLTADGDGAIDIRLRTRHDAPLEMWGIHYHEKAVKRAFGRGIKLSVL